MDCQKHFRDMRTEIKTAKSHCAQIPSFKRSNKVSGYLLARRQIILGEGRKEISATFLSTLP